MEQGRVRIADIAEELGLSTTTVSNVIHGKTKKISDETVKRVQALLEEKNTFPTWRESMHIPFVVYDGYFGETERICNLIIDDYDGGWQMGEYLKRMGHEKVLCIADNYICMDKERIEGCKAALGEQKVGFLQIPFEKEARKRTYRERSGEILEYTAVLAVSDFYAAELMHSLQEQGICVPDDISVAGFDDSPLCERVSPELTSVRQDTKERAKQAVRLLGKLKQGIRDEQTVRLPVDLVERGSVKMMGLKKQSGGKYGEDSK